MLSLFLMNFHTDLPLFLRKKTTEQCNLQFELFFFLIKVMRGRTVYLKYLQKEIIVLNTNYIVLDYYQVFKDSLYHLIFTKNPMEYFILRGKLRHLGLEMQSSLVVRAVQAGGWPPGFESPAQPSTCSLASGLLFNLPVLVYISEK